MHVFLAELMKQDPTSCPIHFAKENSTIHELESSIEGFKQQKKALEAQIEELEDEILGFSSDQRGACNEPSQAQVDQAFTQLAAATRPTLLLVSCPEDHLGGRAFLKQAIACVRSHPRARWVAGDQDDFFYCRFNDPNQPDQWRSAWQGTCMQMVTEMTGTYPLAGIRWMKELD